MRNLLAYPITNEERLDILEQIKKNILEDQLFGDIRALVIQECIDHIKNINPS